MESDSEDKRLQELWRQVLTEYEKITNESLGNGHVPDLDEMQAKLSELSQADKGEIVKKSAEAVFNVAKYTASAASSVLPYASIVFDALSALGNTAQGYKENYTKKCVLEQLKSVAWNLDRIPDYMKLDQDGLQLDTSLRTTIVQLFTGILMLCKIYRKVDKDSETLLGPIKNVMKAAIRHDGGLKSNLEKIKDTTDRELRNNVAALRVSTMYANSDRDSDKLNEFLEIDRTGRNWDRDQETRAKKHIKGMGDWLYELPQFKAWADFRDNSKPVLILNAIRGSGKSFLCSQAIRFLEEKYRAQNPDRAASVCWYFFPETGARRMDSLAEGKKETEWQYYGSTSKASLRDALVALVWQMAKGDRVFRSFAVKQFNTRPHGFSKAVDIWTELIFKFVKETKPAGRSLKAFFLVLDASEEPTNGNKDEKEALFRILKDTKSQKKSALIRVLLSGDMCHTELNKFPCIKRPEEHLQFDAEIFVEDRLKQSYECWSKDPEGRRAIWALHKKVISGFQGDFHVLNESLNEIMCARRLRDLRELKKRGLGLSTATERHLETLSEKLGDDELEDLNEVIACLVCFKVWPTLRQLKAYLCLRRGEKTAMSIETQIGNLPAWLISITDQEDVRSPGLQGLFRQEERKTISSSSDHDRPGNRALANNDHLLLPQHVLEPTRAQKPPNDIRVDCMKHCMEEYSARRPRIYFDKLQSHMNIILSLLEAVCCEENRHHADLTCLFKYMATELPLHFAEITKEQLATTPKDTRQKLGRHLHQFFMDGETVETWMPEGDIKELLSKDSKDKHWEDHLSRVLEWLEDSHVKNGFQQRYQHQYVEETAHNKKQHPHDESSQDLASVVYPCVTLDELLRVPIKVIAYQWLQEYNWDALEALRFLNRVSRKADVSRAGEKGRASSEGKSASRGKSSSDKATLEFPFEENEKFSRNHVEVAKRRAMEILGITKMQAHRNPTQDVRMAETFFKLQHYDKARERCEFARVRDPLNIQAALLLSGVMERTNRKKKALEELMNIRHSIQSPQFKEKNPQEWRKQLDRLWRLCDETGSAEEAFTVCRYLSRTFPKDSTVVDKALEWMEKSETLVGSMDILSMPMTGKQNNRSLLTLLFLSSARSPEFHQMFCFALKDRRETVCKAYEDAIVAASDDLLKAIYLCYYNGVALFYQGNVSEAVVQWEQCVTSIQKPQKEMAAPELIFEIFSMAVCSLGSAYIDIVKRDKTKNARDYIDNMENYKAWVDRTHPLKANFLALVLARLYYVSGHYKRARSSVKKNIASAFHLLKDGEEENDWRGYFMLAEALIVLEDDDNARVAWSIIVNEPDSEWISNISIACAGGCGWTWADSKREPRDVFICKDCAHVHLERKCYDLLQKNLLQQRVCGKSHSFLTVPKSKYRDVRSIQTGKVLVGNNKMKIKDWKNNVRHKYGIRKPGLPWPGKAVESLHIVKWELQRGLDAATGAFGSSESRL